MGQYPYFFIASLTLAPWLILFLLRQDLRREMLIISFITGIVGVVSGWLWYTRDWWEPVTLTGTKICIEDFICGFGAGGVSAVIYKEIFHKTIYRSKSLKISHWILVLPLLLTFIIAHFLFSYFGWYSFWANLAGLVFGLILISFLRKDLEKEALGTGLIITIIGIPFYWLVFLVFPNFREETWTFNNVSGILFLGIPYEDLVWLFFSSSFIAVLYDYWNLLKLRNIPKDH